MARAVGRNVLRKEGGEKVSGAAKYIDDLSFPDLLHARTIRSTIPAGEIERGFLKLILDFIPKGGALQALFHGIAESFAAPAFEALVGKFLGRDETNASGQTLIPGKASQ